MDPEQGRTPRKGSWESEMRKQGTEKQRGEQGQGAKGRCPGLGVTDAGRGRGRDSDKEDPRASGRGC